MCHNPRLYSDNGLQITDNRYADHLNTPRRVVTNDTNQIVWKWDATPFGETQPNEDPDNDNTAFTLNLRFPGQYYDAESNLV